MLQFYSVLRQMQKRCFKRSHINRINFNDSQQIPVCSHNSDRLLYFGLPIQSHFSKSNIIRPYYSHWVLIFIPLLLVFHIIHKPSFHLPKNIAGFLFPKKNIRCKYNHSQLRLLQELHFVLGFWHYNSYITVKINVLDYYVKTFTQCTKMSV